MNEFIYCSNLLSIAVIIKMTKCDFEKQGFISANSPQVTLMETILKLTFPLTRRCWLVSG